MSSVATKNIMKCGMNHGKPLIHLEALDSIIHFIGK